MRYLERLIRLARRQTPQDMASRFDPEDIVQSVFRTFFRRASSGQYALPEGDEYSLITVPPCFRLNQWSRMSLSSNRLQFWVFLNFKEFLADRASGCYSSFRRHKSRMKRYITMKSQRSNRNRPTRKLLPEALEARQLMASDLAHNFLLPHDVNDDHRVTPSDALMVINKLNRRGMDDTPQTSRSHFEDVNDDSRLTPSDALTVINRINSQAAVTGQPAAKEAWVSSATNSAMARFEFEASGSEIEMSIKVIGAAASTSYAVSLNDFALGQLTTDDRGRGKLVLSQGDDNREHLPLPNDLPPITADTELIIGDIVRGRLSTLAGNDDNGGHSDDDHSNGNQGGTGGSSNSNSGGNSSNSNQSESEWLATFANVGKFRRKAEFETETERGMTKSKFKAQVEGGAANTTYEVTVGGISVGQVTTNARGKAKLILSTSPKQGELVMPTNFPTVDATTVVKIGDASATFIRIR